MKNIIALCDYKNRFGSKDNAVPYRSGMDLQVLRRLWSECGRELVYRKFHEVCLHDFHDQYVIYTSQEDSGYKYKDFIEDIIQYLELTGTFVIPEYKYLRANNNKVYMELLRRELLSADYQLDTQCFGCLEEAVEESQIGFPVVVKAAKGASGTGVFLAKNKNELRNTIRRVSKTGYITQDIIDRLRALKHPGYIRNSSYRERFILQRFIPNLKNDWKVYVFWDKLFVFYRPVLKNRVFKASGGGYENYNYGVDAQIPQGLFEYALKARQELQVPHVSLDIAYDGVHFYLIEYQCLYFGTAGIVRSQHCFKKVQNSWVAVVNKETVESVYVYSVEQYLGEIS